LTITATGPQLHRLRVNEAEADAIRRLAEACGQDYTSSESEEFLHAAPVIADEMPRRVRQAMNEARLDETLHAIVVEGHMIDVSALGRTPGHWRDAANDASREHGFMLVLYASLLGDVFGWETQQDSRMVTDVLPSRGLEHSTVSASSELELGWHTEDAFCPYRANYVGLYCLRNPGSVATTIGALSIGALDEISREILFEPRFHFRSDPSHERGYDRWGALQPILRGARDQPVLCIDSDYTRPAMGDDLAAHAFASARNAIDRDLYEVVLAPGDVCFLDNQNVVHGRRAFRARYDGRDRWLKRVNVTRDLRRSAEMRTGPLERVVMSR
jgi:Fe(II)/alpha-ketoglutarate-dependent arginine beta-hydroxylase